jgi:hypothetical protein
VVAASSASAALERVLLNMVRSPVSRRRSFRWAGAEAVVAEVLDCVKVLGR